jgi:hypothetical protein
MTCGLPWDPGAIRSRSGRPPMFSLFIYMVSYLLH